MQVTHTYNPSAHTVLFHIRTENTTPTPLVHRTPRRCTTLKESTFRILLPDSIESFDTIHNDVWALVVLLVVFPFVRTELRLSFGVSKEFALGYSEHCGKSIVPINPVLAQRTASHPSHPSVAFNGRMHSFLTAVVLGPSSRLVAMDHWDSMLGERTSPYPPDVLYYAMDKMESKGHRVCLLKTDIQSLYEPYGFVHPITSVLGNVLFADALQLGSVHMGCRLDDMSAYGAYRVEQKQKQKKRSTDTRITVDGELSVPSRCVSFRDEQLYVHQHKQPELTLPFWRNMLQLVGIKIDFPLCGVSDVLLVKLLAEHKMWHEANYCLYSRPLKRCGQCLECLYYNALHTSVTTHSVNIDKVWQQFTDKYPEATTSVRNVDTPCRWNLFWLEMVRRDDMTPVQTRGFDILCAYRKVYQQRKFVVNSMRHIVTEEHYDRVRVGLGRVMGVLNK